MFQRISGIENFFAWGGYHDFQSGVARFSVDYFMSQSTDAFEGEAFGVSIISGIEKFSAQEGYTTIFCRKFFVSQYRKVS